MEYNCIQQQQTQEEMLRFIYVEFGNLFQLQKSTFAEKSTEKNDISFRKLTDFLKTVHQNFTH